MNERKFLFNFFILFHFNFFFKYFIILNKLINYLFGVKSLKEKLWV
jgi:hypothetical protein